MRVKLTSAAFADVARILDWYDAQAPGIGARFLNELDGLTLRLANNPAQFPAIRGDVRRAWFRRFPYALLFRIRPDIVEVFGCFHARRDPQSWQSRN